VAELILATHWSWDEYERTPPYIRQVVWDVLQIRRRIDAERIDEQNRKAEAAARQGR
jgi:hypothetical protein